MFCVMHDMPVGSGCCSGRLHRQLKALRWLQHALARQQHSLGTHSQAADCIAESDDQGLLGCALHHARDADATTQQLVGHFKKPTGSRELTGLLLLGSAGKMALTTEGWLLQCGCDGQTPGVKAGHLAKLAGWLYSGCLHSSGLAVCVYPSRGCRGW